MEKAIKDLIEIYKQKIEECRISIAQEESERSEWRRNTTQRTIIEKRLSWLEARLEAYVIARVDFESLLDYL